MKRATTATTLQKRGSEIVRESHWSPTPMTLATLEKLEQHGVINMRRAMARGYEFYIHDNSSPAYTWLLPGWLAEERVVESGRCYKYYYDPSGGLYTKKYEVLNAWEKLGVIVLDP